MLLLPLLYLSPAAFGHHQGCDVPVVPATEVGPFYVVGAIRFLYEETNGMPGLQPYNYGCVGHSERMPSDTCYYDGEQTTSTVCPIQVANRWLP